jgi:hypothetical protein
MTVLEADVTLTDFALAIECACFSAWLYQYRATVLGLAFMILFSAVGIAALLGAVVHGFLPDTESPLFKIVWPSTLIAIGLAAFASWVIVARLLFSERATRFIIGAAGLVFALHTAYILLFNQSFGVAIANYLPATFFLLIAFAVTYRRRRDGFLMAGIWGLVLSFIAAAIQQIGIGLHPLYFNHNALYHLIQAIGLFLLFWTARGLVKAPAT